MNSLILILMTLSSSWAAVEPEKDSTHTAKILRPISNETWQNLTGQNPIDQYEVTKGDTLWTISERLFGDPKVWPKVWALNNRSVTNPHLIRPGLKIFFSAGSLDQLPSLAMGEPPQGTAPGSATTSDNLSNLVASSEWKDLPKQSWELQFTDPTLNVDAYGLDLPKKDYWTAPRSSLLPMRAYTKRLDARGRIRGARTESKSVSIGQTVFIESFDNIAIGTKYTVTNTPDRLQSENSDRMGFIYNNYGTIEILALRDDVYVGRVAEAYAPIPRDALLVDSWAQVPPLTPINGPEPLEATVFLNPEFENSSVVDNDLVLLDRGKSDGIQPGMVFRAYDYRDPSNQRRITKRDFIIRADMIVLDTSDDFCVARVMRGFGTVTKDLLVVLLTDVSDLSLGGDTDTKPFGAPGLDQDLSELDRLDPDSTVNYDKRELKQLEEWKENPPETPTDSSSDPSQPDTASSPNPEATTPDDELDQLIGTDPTPNPALEPTPVPESDPAAQPSPEAAVDSAPAEGTSTDADFEGPSDSNADFESPPTESSGTTTPTEATPQPATESPTPDAPSEPASTEPAKPETPATPPPAGNEDLAPMEDDASSASENATEQDPFDDTLEPLEPLPNELPPEPPTE